MATYKFIFECDRLHDDVELVAAMNSLSSFFDRYTIMARQRPALLMLLPALVGAIVLLPSLRSWWATLLTVTSACGVSVALSEFAQAKGKALELGLIKLWGGLPSVAMLRHRDTRLDTHTKTRYKGFLQNSVPGLVFPDGASELADPAGADQVYESATKWLLVQTRDKKVYPLLFEWNISYGFRRNMLGMRPYGIFVAVITVIITLLWNLRVLNRTGQLDDTLVIGSVAALAALWFWITAVKSGWVEFAANGYARELLAACDRLSSAGGRKATSKRAAVPAA